MTSRLVYCKQCNRLIQQSEIDAGEAYVTSEGAWCKTCALGKGFDVSVGRPPSSRRRRASSLGSAARRRGLSPLGALAAVLAVVALGAGLTIAVFTRALWGRAGRTEGSSQPPAKEGPALPLPGGGRTSPGGQGSGERSPAAGGAAQAPRVLSPEEVRSLARVEWEKTSARARELEGEGSLVRAMEVLANFPFEYRHTEYHSLAAKERERLSAECVKAFDGLEKEAREAAKQLRSDDEGFYEAGLLLGMRGEPIRTAEVGPRLDALRNELWSQLAGRMAPAIAACRERELRVNSLLWRPGKAASVTWKSQSAEITFAPTQTGRELSLILPEAVTWNLSPYRSIGFVLPRCPERATFTVEIASGGLPSAAVAAREGAVFTVQLDSLAIDLGKVERITLTLAEPAGEEVRCTLSAVTLAPK